MRRLMVTLMGASVAFLARAFWIAQSTRRMLAASSGARRAEGRTSVHLPENSPTLIRDLLIWCNEWARRRSGARDAVDLYIASEAAFDNIGEILTCVQLSPATADTRFCWMDAAADDRVPVGEGSRGSGHRPAGAAVLFDRGTRPIDAHQHFHDCTQNVLQLPLSVESWAKDRLKQYHPGSFIVCAHLLDEMFGDGAARAAYCRSFFTRLLAELPAVHCLLLDSFRPVDREWSADLPNVTFTKRLGYSFLEELALVREADLYIGSYGSYAPILIGTAKPFVLLGLDPARPSSAPGNLDPVARAPQQLWIRKVPSAAELFATLNDLYEQAVTDRRAGEPFDDAFENARQVAAARRVMNP